jgi:hypothetical protein
MRHDTEIATELVEELEDVIRAESRRGLRLIEPWPFARGPAGLLRGPDGELLHGGYARPLGHQVELLVANNGWPVEFTLCPTPLPPAAEVYGPVNYWVAQQPSLVVDGERLRAIDPGDAAISRVAAGAKLLGLAETDDVKEAYRWVEAATKAQLACSMEEYTFTDCGGETVWFVTVARRDRRFADLLDLDALSEWYRRALPAAGLADRVERVATSLAALAERPPSDFLDRTDDLIVAPMLDDDPDAVGSVATGVILGYWPPTTVALMARHADPSSHGDHVGRFPSWDRLRFAAADAAVEISRDLLAETA